MDTSKIPKRVMEELDYYIARNDLDYADNYRAYRLKDEYLRDEYKAALSDGCCGFFDIQVLDDDRNKWIVGCNYGH